MPECSRLFTVKLHRYKRVARLNDYDVKLIKAKREFVWHSHPDTDELFFALEGAFSIRLRDTTLRLNPGEMVVVPKSVEHKPICDDVCTVLLIEPTGTVNTGDAGGALTDTDLEDI